MMKQITKEVLERAEQIQNDIHESIEGVVRHAVTNRPKRKYFWQKKKPIPDFQDMTNVLLFHELAKLQLAIESFKNKKDENITD